VPDLGDTRLRGKLDMERLIFDGDREMREALLSDKRFVKVLVSQSETKNAIAARRQLLLSALRLTPEMAPEPFAALRQASETLGIETPIELYCVSESAINAFVVPPRPGGVVLLGLTSEALERFDPGELAFVFGHELGHALFGHFHFSPDVLIGDDSIAPIHVARLCAWMRYAELSADRIGLLCCDDFDTAVRAFFKLTSGLSNNKYLRHAAQCAEQFAAVTAETIESSEGDWFSTHPYSPLRIKALDLFSRSETYHALLGRRGTEARFHRLMGKSGQALTEVELEKEIAKIMQLMDPCFLRNDKPSNALIREFLALAGVEVALADGTIQRGEKKMLGKLVGRRGLIEDAAATLELSPEEHGRRMRELADALMIELSPIRRQKIVEDLVAIALADRELLQAEVDAVAHGASLLHVSPEFVISALNRAVAQLD
jgi:uncharacterized tellurite resistance protein B-like protein